MFSENRNKFLSIGNIDRAVNKTEFGEKIAYGGGTYTGITANELGWDTTILTKGNEQLSEWLIELEDLGIRVIMQPDDSITSFYNDYTSGIRVQKLVSKTGKIIFDLEEKFDVIHIAPLFHEVDLALVKKAKNKCKLLSLDVQGLVREEKNGIVEGVFLEDRKEWFNEVDILKVGEEEIKYVSEKETPEEICKDLKSLGPKIVTLTFGKKGSVVFGKKFYNIPTIAVKEVDPTGAGDVYATAFVIKYFETKDERDAGFFAAAASSFVVEDFGARNIQSREKVEERVKQMKL